MMAYHSKSGFIIAVTAHIMKGIVNLFACIYKDFISPLDVFCWALART